jgi:hypothetical protein
MHNDYSHRPRFVPQVMVSSTFTDLRAHREALIEAVHAHQLHANVMENDSARLVDVIDSSLQMVRDSAAYIGVISLKYGQTPECPTRNPHKLSITELEFNEAQSLRRPILLFIMGEDHPVKRVDIEKDPEKELKLNVFRERAKKASPDSLVNRVYAVFNDLEEFKSQLGSSLAELRQRLDAGSKSASSEGSRQAPRSWTIPPPPAFYAEPDYIGSHKFVGRARELEELTDWAKPADPTNLLLFEAIGGNGKSMLTWEWTKNHAVAARPSDSPWAGRFWYSFYERGAVMADFCRRALAYMTGRPLEEYSKKKTAELKDELLIQLHARPWLVILDGLERVLVAYHRIDAAEVPDEEANAPTDKIAHRNPTDAIRDEDNDLLRALAVATPSKLLVSSRLTPRVLLNSSGQPIPGAKRITLPGLRPPDAESLLRSCGIEGDSLAIQKYLTANCDNHPLVIGILGGLIASYLPTRGNFDTWSVASDGGAALDLASLDLIQRRNHILRAALDALPPESRQLLSTLALLTESADYTMLEAFNPHIPPEPNFVRDPDEKWRPLSSAEKKKQRAAYRALSPEKKKAADAAREKRELAYSEAFERYKIYVEALVDWRAIASSPTARQELTKTVRDLETRGLLQFDGQTSRYDLHPVVRGVTAGGQRPDEITGHGQRVVDHFSSRLHSPYDQAETAEDLGSGLGVVRTLLKLGQLEKAAEAYVGSLSTAHVFNLEAYVESLAILKPFFPKGWGEFHHEVSIARSSQLATWAGISLHFCGECSEALRAFGTSLKFDVEEENSTGLHNRLRNIARSLTSLNLLSKALRVDEYAVELAKSIGTREELFKSLLDHFRDISCNGATSEAEKLWELLDPMGRDWSRSSYRPGDAEFHYARWRLLQGSLTDAHLTVAERLAKKGKNRSTIRQLHALRGAWRLNQGKWVLAAASFQEAVRLARERSLTDAASETGLALAKYHLDQLPNPCDEAERLAQLRDPAHRYLSLLWLAIGEREQAKNHAIAAYKWAWADGEPYVHRYELTKTTELLQQLEIPIPNLPPYDVTKDELLPWEADVQAVIKKLRVQKETKRKAADLSAK